MTSHENLLEALFEKDLLSQFGTMLGGFVHNINGPLHNISLLVERVGRNHQELNRLIEIETSCQSEELQNISLNQLQRLQQLSQQVSTLTNMVHDFRLVQDMVRHQPKVDLKLVLGRLVDLCRCDRFVKYEVCIELHLAKDVPLIPIPGSKLIPALMHLLQNALNAVREAEQKKVVIESRKDGDRVWVIFRDSGCGYNPNQEQEAFFELFYVNWPEKLSTDNAPKHSGFGLYSVRALLCPYGVEVTLRRDERETLAVLEVPLASK